MQGSFLSACIPYFTKQWVIAPTSWKCILCQISEPPQLAPQNPFRLISAAGICNHILRFPMLMTITEGWKLYYKYPEICKKTTKERWGWSESVSASIYCMNLTRKPNLLGTMNVNPSTVRVYLTFQQLFCKDDATPTLHMLHPAHRTGRYDLILNERVAATELPWVE